jgi:hypothetical protein
VLCPTRHDRRREAARDPLGGRSDGLQPGVAEAVHRLRRDDYLIDGLLTDEERAIQGKVRTFADREVIPVINGILLEYHVARHTAGVEAVYTKEGTDAAQTLMVGREITDLNSFA